MKTLRLIPVFGAPFEITKDVLVGRDAACDVVIPDGSVSRRHARIEWRGENWAIIDQASANGTFLDSQRVAEAGLRHGQELRLGGVPLKVEIEGEAEDLGATTISSAVQPDATVMQPPAPPPRPPAPAPPPAPPAAPAPRPPAARPPAPPAPALPRPAAQGPVTASLPPRPRFSQTSPPPAPKKGRGPLFWVATGCLGCLGIVVLIAALVAGGFYAMTRGPVEAVRGQLAEIRQGNLDEAYSRLSGAAQARVSRGEFERALHELPALRQHTEAEFGFPSGSVQVVNARAEVNGFLVAPGGAREKAEFELVREAGDWRIESIRIGGRAALGG